MKELQDYEPTIKKDLCGSVLDRGIKRALCKNKYLLLLRFHSGYWVISATDVRFDRKYGFVGRILTLLDLNLK